jgi:hypothetical protein
MPFLANRAGAVEKLLIKRIAPTTELISFALVSREDPFPNGLIREQIFGDSGDGGESWPRALAEQGARAQG